MKNYFVLFMLILTSLSAQADTEIKTEKQRLSYAMGVSFASNIASRNIDIDIPIFLQAVEDMLSNNDLKLSIDQMKDVLARYRDNLDDKLSQVIANNKRIGRAFLAKNKKEEGIIESTSGLQYKIIRAGKGKNPTVNNSVTIHYKGTLVDGAVFDSSYDRNEPITIPLTQVIKGWQEAVPMMKTGAKWQIYIPSELAYGDRAAGQLIVPGSTLIFEIELISIDP